MITLHARFAKQGFEGQADWKLIEQMRAAVTVPLIGNGDVKQPEDALKMLRETGCDGVMVGRAAISNPWALGKISAAVSGLRPPAAPTMDERIEVALEHVRLSIAYNADVETYDEALALPIQRLQDAEMHTVRSLRGQIPMYIKGEPGAAQAREHLTRCSSLLEVESELRKFQSSLALAVA